MKNMLFVAWKSVGCQSSKTYMLRSQPQALESEGAVGMTEDEIVHSALRKDPAINPVSLEKRLSEVSPAGAELQ